MALLYIHIQYTLLIIVPRLHPTISHPLSLVPFCHHLKLFPVLFQTCVLVVKDKLVINRNMHTILQQFEVRQKEKY